MVKATTGGYILLADICFVLDILIGMPYTTPGDILQKVREEHMRCLVAEMEIRVRLIHRTFILIFI